MVPEGKRAFVIAHLAHKLAEDPSGHSASALLDKLVSRFHISDLEAHAIWLEAEEKAYPTCPEPVGTRDSKKLLRLDKTKKKLRRTL